MRRRSGRLAGGLFVALLACAAFGAGVFLVVRHADVLESIVPVSEILALRFPDEWTAAPTRLSDTQIVLIRAFAAPMGTSDGSRPSGISFAPMRISEEQFLAAVTEVEARAPRRPAARPDAVFNDAQIVSIKERLALTAEQEEHWPPMEAALRNMSWEKRPGASGPTLESLQRLHEVALSFVARLNDRQKREVRTLANIVGLKIDFNGR